MRPGEARAGETAPPLEPPGVAGAAAGGAGGGTPAAAGGPAWPAGLPGKPGPPSTAHWLVCPSLTSHWSISDVTKYPTIPLFREGETPVQ